MANIKSIYGNPVVDDPLRQSVATEYSSSSTYVVGDMCLKDGVLYRCTTAISTAEAWTAAHWTAVTVGEKIADLEADTSSLKEDFRTTTRNLADIKNDLIIGKAWNLNNNTGRAIVNVPFEPNTRYVISYNAAGNVFDNIIVFEKTSATVTTNVTSATATNGYTAVSKSTTNVLCIQFNKDNISTDHFANINLQVEKASVPSPYVKHFTALDKYAREGFDNFATPEQFGAWGDGTHDDTEAFQKAIDNSSVILAPNTYLISRPLIIHSTVADSKQVTFNKIVNTGTGYAIRLYGYNGKLYGVSINSASGSGVAIGQQGLTQDWDININLISAPTKICYELGGSEQVTEIEICGGRCDYGDVAVYLNTNNYWVGQVSFKGICFTTSRDAAHYAFYANGTHYPVTGLTLINISFEGAHGGLELVNSQASTPIERIFGLGIRTCELSVVYGYNVIRYTGSGVLKGAFFLDQAKLSSFDFSGAPTNPNHSHGFMIQGRLDSGDSSKTFGEATVYGNKVVPKLYEIYGTATGATFTDSNLPPAVCYMSGACSFTTSMMWEGEYVFIASAANASLTMNETIITLSNSGDSVSITSRMDDNRNVKYIARKSDGTTVII